MAPVVAPTTIVTTAERPDLVPRVADWLWQAFWKDSGKPYEQLLAAARKSAMGTAMPCTFVLLCDGQPVGTASLVAHDLDERPDLSPWLAGVFVEPHARHQGFATRLIAAVEQAAAVDTLWLYTEFRGTALRARRVAVRSRRSGTMANRSR